MQNTKGGNLKEGGIDVVASEVKNAWISIPRENIVKTKNKYYINNSMDDSEDDLMYKIDEENSWESEFFDEEATERDFIELFGESDSIKYYINNTMDDTEYDFKNEINEDNTSESEFYD